MATKLKNYFPIIREREEVMAEIRKSGTLHGRFDGWPKEKREEFLDLCTGAKGLKLLYDGFFKEVMNPEYVPQRLSDFLSCMLGQKVRVIRAIPTDSTRLADESVLLAMDIVVELEDGSIANVEMQRIGYLFPGQRSACYSADLLLRQYKRLRGSRKNFRYRDIRNVYTIVLFEKSPQAFHAYPETCYHFFEQKSDTGLEMELVQKYLFIPLDIFMRNPHNRDRRSRRDAWLTLFSSDDPDRIVELLEDYPEFKEIYREGYQICRNMEKIMGIFSEELHMLDRNTERYMFDEMQNELDEMRDYLSDMRNDLAETQSELTEAQNNLAEAQNDLTETQNNLTETQNDLTRMNDKYTQAVKNGVALMRSLKLSETEIMDNLRTQYGLDETQAKEYL